MPVTTAQPNPTLPDEDVRLIQAYLDAGGDPRKLMRRYLETGGDQRAIPMDLLVAMSKALRYVDFLKDTLPRAWTVDAPHIRLIAEHLDAALRGEIDRLAFFMPPRHGKSETITYRFPLRWMEANPGSNVLVTGYNERFARKFGRRTRNLAKSRGLVSSDKSAADEWEMVTGGLYMARGVGSPPTGTGFQLINIDDPIRRREDAESKVCRDKVWDWYTDDLYTRLEPGGVIVLVMTLWHEDDVGARAIASEPGRWTICNLPALAEDANDALGRAVGAALWPDRYDEAALTRIREVLVRNEGERSWNALYQQRPSAREGSFFKVGAINYCDSFEVPPLIRECRAWDIAATKDGGDFTVGARMGITADNRIYVTDIVRGQWSTDEVDNQMLQAAKADGRDVTIHIPQDPGAAGVKSAAAFIRMLTGYNAKSERVSGDKPTRARPLSSQLNAGNVWFVRGHWNGAAKEEMRTFQGKTDDIVDALADAFNELTGQRQREFYVL